jgi:hypothetical protein
MPFSYDKFYGGVDVTAYETKRTIEPNKVGRPSLRGDEKPVGMNDMVRWNKKARKATRVHLDRLRASSFISFDDATSRPEN